MTYLDAARFVALAALPLATPGLAAANSCGVPGVLESGFLGVPPYGSLGDDEFLPVPRNVAIVRRATTPPDVSFRTVEHEVVGLWRPESPLPPEREIILRDQAAITTTEIDTESPTGVELIRVGFGGCGISLELDGPPSDDLTETDRLTYVIYSAGTPEEAARVRDSHSFAIAGRGFPPGVSRDFIFAYTPRRSVGETWIAVSVLDLAGNESPRSAPVEYVAPSQGCDAVGGSQSLTSVAILGALCVLTLRARRRRDPF